MGGKNVNPGRQAGGNAGFDRTARTRSGRCLALMWRTDECKKTAKQAPERKRGRRASVPRAFKNHDYNLVLAGSQGGDENSCRLFQGDKA